MLSTLESIVTHATTKERLNKQLRNDSPFGCFQRRTSSSFISFFSSFGQKRKEEEEEEEADEKIEKGIFIQTSHANAEHLNIYLVKAKPKWRFFFQRVTIIIVLRNKFK